MNSNIFDLIYDFEEKEQAKKELLKFDYLSFNNGFLAGRYSILYDQNFYKQYVQNWFIRKQTHNILSALGYLIDSETLSLKLSDDVISNLKKDERLSIDIFNALTFEIKNLSENKEIDHEHIKQIYKKINRYSLNEFNYDFKDESSFLYNLYIENIKTPLELLKLLLRGEYESNLICPKKIGLLLSSRLISQRFTLIRPLFCANIFAIKNKGYEEALSENNSNIWENYILSNIGQVLEDNISYFMELNITRKRIENMNLYSRTTSRIPLIIDYLFLYPIITRTKIQYNFNISNTANSKIFDTLLDKNLLRPIGNENRNSNYICDTIIQMDRVNYARNI
jgi:hypothetical protein